MRSTINNPNELRDKKRWLFILVDIFIILVFFYLINLYQKRLPSSYQVINNIGYKLTVGYKTFSDAYIFQIFIFNKTGKPLRVELDTPYIECTLQHTQDQHKTRIKIPSSQTFTIPVNKSKKYQEILSKKDVGLKPGFYRATALFTNKDRIQISTVFDSRIKP